MTLHWVPVRSGRKRRPYEWRRWKYFLFSIMQFLVFRSRRRITFRFNKQSGTPHQKFDIVHSTSRRLEWEIYLANNVFNHQTSESLSELIYSAVLVQIPFKLKKHHFWTTPFLRLQVIYVFTSTIYLARALKVDFSLTVKLKKFLLTLCVYSSKSSSKWRHLERAKLIWTNWNVK